MADGSKVAVVKDEPLPEPVKAAVVASLQQLQDSGQASSYEGFGTFRSTMAAKAAEADRATGKRTVIVYRRWGAPLYDENNYQWDWFATRPGAIQNANGSQYTFVPSRDEAITQVQSWVAKQADASVWEILVTE